MAGSAFSKLRQDEATPPPPICGGSEGFIHVLEHYFTLCSEDLRSEIVPNVPHVWRQVGGFIRVHENSLRAWRERTHFVGIFQSEKPAFVPNEVIDELQPAIEQNLSVSDLFGVAVPKQRAVISQEAHAFVSPTANVLHVLCKRRPNEIEFPLYFVVRRIYDNELCAAVRQVVVEKIAVVNFVDFHTTVLELAFSF